MHEVGLSQSRGAPCGPGEGTPCGALGVDRPGRCPNAGPLLFGSAPGVVFRMLLELMLVLILPCY